MKKNIHPKYNSDAKAKCACGATFVTGSTKDSIQVEICSSCHPFYTGKQKLVDKARRVEKFAAKTEKAKSLSAKPRKTKKEKNQERKAKRVK